jgi:DNA-binding MarR family transcriptional regulator
MFYVELLAIMDKKYYNVVSLISEVRELAHQFIVQRMEALGIKGLVTSHGSILIHLYVNGPTKMNEIAKKINKKKNTVTTLVNKLVKHGYVVISVDESDHRVKLVTLTQKAIDIQEDFFGISNDLIEKTFSGIDEEKRNDFVSLLYQVKENLSKF